MADEKEKILKLEERLEKAASTYKDMKVQLDDKSKENEALKVRISELEDELTLNGGAVEEIENLKNRLEKAKEIFANQKTKIGELTRANSDANDQLTERKSEIESLNARVSELEKEVDLLTNSNGSLKEAIGRIKEIVSCYNQE